MNRTWRAVQLATGDDTRDETRERRRHRLIKQVEEDIASFGTTPRSPFSSSSPATSTTRRCGTARRIDAETLSSCSLPSRRSSPRSSATPDTSSVHERGTWPAYDDELAAPQRASVAITVNGKLRGQLEVAAGASTSS